jgi:hypothetical protein
MAEGSEIPVCIGVTFAPTGAAFCCARRGQSIIRLLARGGPMKDKTANLDVLVWFAWVALLLYLNR